MGCPVLFLVQKREREKKLYGDGTYVTLLLEVRLLNPSYVVRGTCRVAKYLMNGSEAFIVNGVI